MCVSNVCDSGSLRIRAAHAFVVAAVTLAPIGTCAAWSYSERNDPFDQRPGVKFVTSRVDQFPVAAFRRSDGDDSVDLVILLAESKQLDPDHSILIRIDSNPTQELSASADRRLTVTHQFHKERKYYYYHALDFPEHGAEFSWAPNRITIPIIGDIDDRQKLDTVPTYTGRVAREHFDALKNPPYSPEGLFLNHLLKGDTLFLRYTAIGGSEVTERVSLNGLSGPLERLLMKSASEKCSDAALEVVVENGCMIRAIDAAQPLPPGKTIFESPMYSTIVDACIRDAKLKIPECAR